MCQEFVVSPVRILGPVDRGLRHEYSWSVLPDFRSLRFRIPYTGSLDWTDPCKSVKPEQFFQDFLFSRSHLLFSNIPLSMDLGNLTLVPEWSPRSRHILLPMGKGGSTTRPIPVSVNYPLSRVRVDPHLVSCLPIQTTRIRFRLTGSKNKRDLGPLFSFFWLVHFYFRPRTLKDVFWLSLSWVPSGLTSLLS